MTADTNLFGTVRRLGGCLWLALLLGGCATNVPPLGPQPLSEFYRAQLGDVLVVPSFDSEEATSGVTLGKGGGPQGAR